MGRSGHWVKVPAWLSGGYVERTSGQDLNTGGTSVDQVAAEHIGEKTMLPTFELGIEAPRTGVDNAGGGFARMYGSFISWRDPHTPVLKEIVPQLAFDRLYRNPSAPVVSGMDANHSSVIESLQRDRTSVLDLVMDETKSVRRQASSQDQVKLDEYFESVRSVERRMEASLKPQLRWINEGKPPMERPGPGIPQEHAEHVRLMLDILVLAFWTRFHAHRDVHVRRRAERHGLFLAAGRAWQFPRQFAPPQRAGQDGAVREDHRLAYRAASLFPGHA